MRLLLLLLALAVSTHAYKDYSNYQVIRVTPATDDHVTFLISLMSRPELDFWNDGVAKGRPVDIMTTREHIPDLQTLVNVFRIEHSIFVENVEDAVQAEREQLEAARAAASGRAFDYSYYMTYTEMGQFYNELIGNCTMMDANRCSSEMIGNTYEGRPQYVFTITNGDRQPKKKLWVDCGIHAREWISPAVGQYFTERMVYDYGVDPMVTTILDAYDFYILADVNPDGYTYAHESERLWRRNRRPLSANETALDCYGVDVNRNYAHHFGETGTGAACTDTYPGPSAFSEPESTNQNNIMNRLMNDEPGFEIIYFLTLHSYSQLWMTPYGFSTTDPSNLPELLRVASAGVAALEAVHGTNYVYGEASDILGYSTSGTSRDWAAGTMNIRFVFTIELRPEDSPPGFVLPPAQILPTVQETWAGYKASVIEMMNGLL